MKVIHETIYADGKIKYLVEYQGLGFSFNHYDEIPLNSNESIYVLKLDGVEKVSVTSPDAVKAFETMIKQLIA